MEVPDVALALRPGLRVGILPAEQSSKTSHKPEYVSHTSWYLGTCQAELKTVDILKDIEQAPVEINGLISEAGLHNYITIPS